MLGTSTLIGTTAEGAHDGVSGGDAEAVQPNTNTNTNTTIMIGGEDEKAVSQSSGGGGGVGSAGGDLFESDRSTGGNRWPRQETLALLKIRSDMDVIFRDSSLKGPLWEEVSRKMAELGYHRSAKKCKEKFENVYKYHKRTKDGRVGKSDGKTYRFFDQLEALEQHHMAIAASQALPPLPQSSPAQVTPRVVHSQSQSQAPAQAAVPVTMVIPAGTNPASVTVPSSPHPISVVHTTSSINTHPQQPQVNVSNPLLNQVPPHLQSSQVLPQQPQHHHQQQQQQQHQTMGSIPTHSSIQMENPSSPSATQSSSSTSSDEELIGRSRKRKRKWKDFFERLMKEVIEKQEDLQKRFLEAVEKREHDRVAREEAWKTQEMSRLNREHEILVQERSMAAAKDAALIAFLQKLSDQQQIPLSLPAQVQPQSQGQGQARAAPPAPAVASVAAPTQPQPQPPPPPPQPQPQPQLQLQQQVLLLPQSQPQPQPQTQPQPQPQTQPPTQPQPQTQTQTQTQINITASQVSLPSPTPPLPKSQSLTQLPQQQSQQLSQALVVANTNNGDNGDFQKTNSGDNLLQASSSRWPKAEVQALINLRTNLDQKYQENGPKGPLWEEISAAMRKLGYNRNAKRCKEKWENINKYFKKVKESNKKRPEDSKTCPYFHQLDALYRERNKMEISTATTTIIPAFGQQQQQQMKHEGASMATVMVQPEQQWPHPNQAMDDQGSENQDDSEDDVDDEDDDDHGSGYEIVANNNNNVNAGSMSTTTAATRTATTE